ncbi:MAG: transporter [Campylobacterota bacterium]|nr:transporter [Campylobacterota bacterium]
MNRFVATVLSIESTQNLNIVEFSFFDEILTMMSLDLNPNIKIGSSVELTLKATQITIAKNFNGMVSDSNQLSAQIKSLGNGQLLSSVELSVHNTTLESIITLKDSKKMNLQIDDDLTIFINPSELSIVSILDD